jgi:hypothetical protein
MKVVTKIPTPPGVKCAKSSIRSSGATAWERFHKTTGKSTWSTVPPWASQFPTGIFSGGSIRSPIQRKSILCSRQSKTAIAHSDP